MARSSRCEWCSLVTRYEETKEIGYEKEDKLPYIVTREPDTGFMVAVWREHGANLPQMDKDRLSHVLHSYVGKRYHLTPAPDGAAHYWVCLHRNVINGGD